MSLLEPTKTQVSKLFPLLEQQDATLEEVATDVLKLAFDLYEQRAKYVAIVQTLGSADEAYERDDPRFASKALGLFATATAARNAAEAAGATPRTGPAAGERCVVWTVPLAHMTTADWNDSRKKAWSQVVDAEAPETAADRLVKIIADQPARGPGPCGHVFVLQGGGGAAFCNRTRGHQGNHDALFPPGVQQRLDERTMFLVQEDFEADDDERG